MFKAEWTTAGLRGDEPIRVKDEDVARLFDRVRELGASAMPAFYTLTSPKLYGVIQRVLADDGQSASVLRDVYRHIWNSRHNHPVPLTMNALVSIAQRFALDHKLAGGLIARVDVPVSAIALQRPDLSESDLNILDQVCAPRLHGHSGPSNQPLNRDDLLARLGALTSNESPS